jgi:hypothetical protein
MAVAFSRCVQQLCSAVVSNWPQNMAHNVVLWNLGGFAMPVLVPLPPPLSARASTYLNCVKNSRLVASVRPLVVWVLNWSSS